MRILRSEQIDVSKILNGYENIDKSKRSQLREALELDTVK